MTYDIHSDDKYGQMNLVDIPAEIAAHEPWFNQTLTTVNDSVVRLGIIEASDERIGSVVDDVLLFCYHYDPSSGKYGTSILRMVRAGGVLTVLAFAIFLTLSLRRDHAVAGSGPVNSSPGHRT